VSGLRARGYTVIGPTRSGEAIVLAELASAADLPYGWGVSTGPGTYRLERRGDDAAFGHAAGPQAWKRFLHPPRAPLWTADRRDGEVTFTAPAPEDVRYAFLGVRPCDLRAIAVQDRVLGVSGAYARRRRDLFLVAVNCTEPASTCFCVSAGGGPSAGEGFDLVLTELPTGYLVETGTEAGAAIWPTCPGHRLLRPPWSRPGRRWRTRPTGWAGRCPRWTCAGCWPTATTRRTGTTWRAAA
jgi:hypothetical protein